jgi:DNA-binding NarL/FixJ family response regulator
MIATEEQAHPQEALEAGADGILDKIIEPEEAISAIRRVAAAG